VKIVGLEIGRFARCSGLGVEYEVLEYAEGGNNDFVHKLRGRARYQTLTLTRGVTHEDALLTWFFKYEKAPQRPAVTVELWGQGADMPIRSFSFAEAFPIKWTGPELAADGNQMATETLEIGHVGFAR
jgi:phage tail-like protein